MAIRTKEQARSFRAGLVAALRLGAEQTQALCAANSAAPPADAGKLLDGLSPWTPGKAYAQYELFSHAGSAGFARQAHTALAEYPPFTPGTEALYGARPAPEGGAYPYVYNMRAEAGNVYLHEGARYVCLESLDAALWPPDALPRYFAKAE